ERGRLIPLVLLRLLVEIAEADFEGLVAPGVTGVEGGRELFGEVFHDLQVGDGDGGLGHWGSPCTVVPCVSMRWVMDVISSIEMSRRSIHQEVTWVSMPTIAWAANAGGRSRKTPAATPAAKSVSMSAMKI